MTRVLVALVILVIGGCSTPPGKTSSSAWGQYSAGVAGVQKR